MLACPGPAGSRQSAGCHQLLRDGAALTTCADDVLEELGLAPGNGPEASPDLQFSAVEAQVFAALEALPIAEEEVVLTTGLTVAQVRAALVRLELLGVVDAGSAGYSRRP